MHLGRFHYVVDHLEQHFREAKLTEELEAAAAALDLFIQTRVESHVADFRAKIAAVLVASEEVRPELLQPYAQHVISDLGLKSLLPPEVRIAIDSVTSVHGFDIASLSEALKAQAKTYSTRIGYLKQLDRSLRGLSAEYTEVDEDHAEIGLLLPRDVVGERLPDLSKEFDKISHLARAVNELMGEVDYDSKVVTISASWWQVFLDIPIEQVAFWTLAIERIVTLFKSNLEIKVLQKQLEDKQMPVAVIKAISDEVDHKVSTGLHSTASDLVKKFGKIEDEGRCHEIENQLRQGLHYLARRMNEGAQVEINIGIPEDPEDLEVNEGEELNQDVIHAHKLLRERISYLRGLRVPAMKASVTSLQIDKNSPLLLEDVNSSAESGSP